jgi:hypothetical protein
VNASIETQDALEPHILAQNCPESIDQSSEWFANPIDVAESEGREPVRRGDRSNSSTMRLIGIASILAVHDKIKRSKTDGPDWGVWGKRMEWGNLLSTLVGGLLSLVAALGTIYLTDKLRERQRMREITLEAAASFYASSQRAAIQMNFYYQEKVEDRKQDFRARYEEYDIEVKRAKFKLAVLLASKEPEIGHKLEDLYARYRNCKDPDDLREFVSELEEYFKLFQERLELHN